MEKPSLCKKLVTDNQQKYKESSSSSSSSSSLLLELRESLLECILERLPPESLFKVADKSSRTAIISSGKRPAAYRARTSNFQARYPSHGRKAVEVIETGWWYGVIGHLETCNGSQNRCKCRNNGES
ncbi:hypothetical protein V2J09_003039 [Rumex salicifolius]